jgi:hypothetical protein
MNAEFAVSSSCFDRDTLNGSYRPRIDSRARKASTSEDGVATKSIWSNDRIGDRQISDGTNEIRCRDGVQENRGE